MRHLLLILSLTFLVSCKRTQSISDVKLLEKESTFDFVSSSKLSDVLATAKENNKLVMIDVYTDWCLPCKMMDSGVFMDYKLGEYVNEKFISYKLDAEKMNGPELSNKYRVQGYPTILFLDQSGDLLLQEVGMLSTSELRDLAEEAWRLGGI